MFNLLSNNMCNKYLNNSFTLDSMHQSTARLYEVLREIGVIRYGKEQSEVAKYLNKSSQVINNWEERGISDNGLLEIQRKTGCSATWLQDGKNPKFLGDHVDPAINKIEMELLNAFNAISTIEKKREIIGFINGMVAGAQKSRDHSIPKVPAKKTA